MVHGLLQGPSKVTVKSDGSIWILKIYTFKRVEVKTTDYVTNHDHLTVHGSVCKQDSTGQLKFQTLRKLKCKPRTSSRTIITLMVRGSVRDQDSKAQVIVQVL